MMAETGFSLSNAADFLGKTLLAGETRDGSSGLKIDQLREDIKTSQQNRQGQRQSGRNQEIKLGFLREKEKRERALRDAVELSQFETKEEKANFLKKRIASLVEEDRDPADSLNALSVLNKDEATFDKGIKRLLKVGAILGDIKGDPTEPAQQTDDQAIASALKVNTSTLEGQRAVAEEKNIRKSLGVETKDPLPPTDIRTLEEIGKRADPPIDTSTTEGLAAARKLGLEQGLIKPPSGFSIETSTDAKGNTVTRIARGPNAGKELDGPTTSVLTQIQKDITDNNQKLGQIQAVRERLNPDFLTLLGQGKFQFLKLKEWIGIFGKLSDEQKGYVTEFTQFRNQTRQFFNQYRKSITGAAAAEREMDFIRESIFNDDQSPTEFLAAVDQMETEIARSNRVMQHMIEEGFTPKSDKEFKAEFDNRFAIGVGIDIESRGAFLEKSGLSPEEIRTKLIKEGYPSTLEPIIP